MRRSGLWSETSVDDTNVEGRHGLHRHQGHAAARRDKFTFRLMWKSVRHGVLVSAKLHTRLRQGVGSWP